MQTRSFIFTWNCFNVSYHSDDTLDSKIRQESVFILYNHKNHSESIHTYILQMKYEIIDIMTIDETVKKDCALIK